MKEWKTADDILDFAINNEQDAVDFYRELAEKAEKSWISELFENYAKEEMGHKAKIEAVKAGQKLKPVEGKQILDLKLGDYLVDIEPSPNMNYQSALVVAMKREKAAFRLYSDMAQQMEDESLRTLFELLAQEEAKHKLRFEVEYDEHILTEN